MRLLPLLLVGCTMGPRVETQITELRVVTAVVEPPEVAPGETTALTITVADPLGLGSELLLWQCTLVDGDCLERSDSPQGWLQVLTPVDYTATASVTPSSALAALLPDDQARAASVLWSLACEPGLCPIFGMAEDALVRDEVSDELAALLADPTLFMADLPLTGVSLAARSIVVSNRPVEARNQNPLVSVNGDQPLVIEAGDDTELVVDVADDSESTEVLAFGFSTIGGFGLPFFEVEQGQAMLSWYAPDEQGEADLFIVVDDDEGGSTLWRGTATVIE